MKFLHVSDLHIGKKLSRLSLAEDQAYILDQIVEMAAQADCVLVAGDVFNRAQPTQEALHLAGDFFEKLSRTRKPVAVIAGNHDNAELIGYCAGVMRSGGIHAVGTYAGELEKITLSDAAGEVDVWLMPFLRPANVRPFHPDVQIDSYEDAIRCVLQHAPIDHTRRNVLVAHQFVAGAVVSESEELIIGGLDQISAEVFEGFDYVALGHLHAPQQVKYGWVRYSGSPLAYSVSEAEGGAKKCALLADMDARGDVNVERVPFAPLRQVRVIRGRFRDVLEMPYSEDYVDITLTDENRPMDAIGALRVNFPNLIGLQWEGRNGRETEKVAVEVMEQVSPVEHFARFYAQQNGGRELNDAQLDLVNRLFDEVSGKGGAQ